MANALVTAQVGLQQKSMMSGGSRASVNVHVHIRLLSPMHYTKPASGCVLTYAFACQLKGCVSVQMVRGPFGSLLPIEVLYYGDGEADSTLAAMLEVGFPCIIVIPTATAMANLQ